MSISSIIQFSVIELALFALIAVPTIYAMLCAPFVPTHMSQVKRMLEAAHIKKGTKVYDLGCGDGRLVHIASKKYGAEAVGYEYSPFVFIWAKLISIFWRSEGKILYRNFWNENVSDANVIFCYLLPHSMEKFKKLILPQLKKGTLIISHAFAIPDLPPLKTLERNREKKLGRVLVYKKQ